MSRKNSSAKSWWHSMTGARVQESGQLALSPLARTLTMSYGPAAKSGPFSVPVAWRQFQNQLERYHIRHLHGHPQAWTGETPGPAAGPCQT